MSQWRAEGEGVCGLRPDRTAGLYVPRETFTTVLFGTVIVWGIVFGGWAVKGRFYKCTFSYFAIRGSEINLGW